jgi:hypothetical protein
MDERIGRLHLVGLESLGGTDARHRAFLALSLALPIRVRARMRRSNKWRTHVTDKKDKRDEKKPDGTFKAGIAVGIGSAAIVAALLYARSHKSKKK